MKKAFTLLELLIGITIFVIVCGAIYSSLYLGIRVYKYEQKNNSLNNEIMLSFNILESNLYSTFINPDDENLTFKGSPGSIEFFNVDKDGFLMRTAFLLETSDERSRSELVMRRKKYLKSEESEDYKSELVNSNVRSLKFSYYDSEQKQWYEDWPEELSLPDQVKIEIDFIDPENSNNTMTMEKYVNIPAAYSIPIVNTE